MADISFKDSVVCALTASHLTPNTYKCSCALRKVSSSSYTKSCLAYFVFEHKLGPCLDLFCIGHR